MWGRRGLKAALAVAAILGALQAVSLAAPEDVGASTRRTMLNAARSCLCRVHYFFKQPEDEVLTPDFEDFEWMPQPSGFEYGEYITKKMSLLTTGLLLDDSGQVLVSDLHIEDKYIERIEVAGPDGTIYPAEQARLLDRTAGVILQVKEPLKGWRAPRFVREGSISDPLPAYAVGISQDGREFWLTVTPVARAYAYQDKAAMPERLIGAPEGTPSGGWAEVLGLFGVMDAAGAASSGPALLCNRTGQPVGALLAGTLTTPGQEIADWQRDRLLNGPALEFSELKELSEQCNEQFGKNLYKCRILFRQRGEGRYDTDSWSIMERLGMMGMGGPSGADRITFGLAVSPDRLLVPQGISREEAAQIEKIEIATETGKLEGEFIGAFKDAGAFMLGVKGGALPAVAVIAPHETPQKMRLFLAVTPKEKFGKKHLEVRPNRWTREERSYKDRYYISPEFPCAQGTWVLDRDLTILGLHTRQRIEGEELAGVGTDMSSFFRMSRAWASGASDGGQRIFWAGEVALMLADPVAHFDRHIRFKTEEEAKRLVWLGVEFTPMSKELAKQLGMEKQTKDGSVGLSVNLVYKGSPAERLGIAVGDILLRVETPKRPHPVELSGSGGYDRYLSWRWSDYMDYDYMEEYGGTEPRWPLRLNYLTMLLRAIGEGETVKLTWLHNGQEVTGDYTIEQAPPDFLSAKKYKNKEIGLTVKDLTYEVRAALRLPDDRQAVVVAKVEPGSPAEVARIEPFELIAAVDGRPVGSAEEFEARIKTALEAGIKKLRLTIEYMGKSRFADLDLTAPAQRLEPERRRGEPEEGEEAE